MKSPEQIVRILNELKYEVKRDNSYLTQIDHDVIELQINQLEKFIQNRYQSHGK